MMRLLAFAGIGWCCMKHSPCNTIEFLWHPNGYRLLFPFSFAVTDLECMGISMECSRDGSPTTWLKLKLYMHVYMYIMACGCQYVHVMADSAHCVADLQKKCIVILSSILSWLAPVGSVYRPVVACMIGSLSQNISADALYLLYSVDDAHRQQAVCLFQCTVRQWAALGQ